MIHPVEQAPSMHECLSKTLSQNCLHGEIAFSLVHLFCNQAKQKRKAKKTYYGAQIREQMSGPEISYYEKSILGSGLWSGLDCEIKGSGPIMSNF